MDTDASDCGIGAVLSQEYNAFDSVIAYAGWALTKTERKYATTKKELLAMITFTTFFKHYLLGREFILRTDHKSLRWLHNLQGFEGQLARWIEQLANFQYCIVYRPGKQHGNADALSRIPSLAVTGVKETHEHQIGSPIFSTSVRTLQEVHEQGPFQGDKGEKGLGLLMSYKGRAVSGEELKIGQQGDRNVKIQKKSVGGE